MWLMVQEMCFIWLLRYSASVPSQLGSRERSQTEPITCKPCPLAYFSQLSQIEKVPESPKIPPSSGDKALSQTCAGQFTLKP